MRTDRWRNGLLALLLTAFAALPALAQDGLAPIPELKARVTDTTGTLSVDETAALESELTALEKRKGAQLGVLLVATTQPEEIAAYAIRVFDQWKLGRNGVDDGALLIIAKGDRRSRIEVGRGLEGAIPDAAAARILREYLTPKFRAGDFNGGIRDTAMALTALIDGEPLAEPWVENKDEGGKPNPFHAIFLGLFGMFWVKAFFGRLSRPARPLLVGGAAGLLTYFIGGSLFGALAVGMVGLLFGWFGGATGRYANSSGGGPFSGGSSSGGGGSWGGSSGGGGFSGGGGSSAGGGASGSW
ncbi:MAG: TPM domain-containing protein [Dokdonella sp.]